MAWTVKGVVIRNGNETLLLKRAKGGVNGGKWDIPGGLLEMDETVEEALMREIGEETGIEVEMGPVIRVSEFSKGHELFNAKRSLRYIVYYRGGEVALNEREHDDYKWMNIDDAIGILDSENGYEDDKKNTLIDAKRYLEMNWALEGWKRSRADLENYRRRIEKDKEEFREYCIQDFVHELLPVVDNFDMATEHIPEEQKDQAWVQGIMHIRNQLSGVLRDRGVEEIDARPGDDFNEEVHEAISGQPKEGKGKIKKVFKKGYRLRDRVIRAANVEVE